MNGGGGSQTTKVEIPAWAEDAAQYGIDRGKSVAEIGYTPFYGGDVAAFTPQQQAGMQGTNQMAQAFGMPTADYSMPQPQNFGGMQGYSSGNLFDLALGELGQRRPEQKAAIDSLFPAQAGGGVAGATQGGAPAQGGQAAQPSEEEIKRAYTAFRRQSGSEHDAGSYGRFRRQYLGGM